MYNEVHLKSWEGENYKFDVEDVEGFAFVHIRKWTPSLSAFKAAKTLLKEVVGYVYEDGYDGLHAFTNNKKLMKKLPFEYIQDIDDGEGGVMGVYKCHRL